MNIGEKKRTHRIEPFEIPGEPTVPAPEEPVIAPEPVPVPVEEPVSTPA
jgi:hypothetical protein